MTKQTDTVAEIMQHDRDEIAGLVRKLVEERDAARLIACLEQIAERTDDYKSVEAEAAALLRRAYA